MRLCAKFGPATSISPSRSAFNSRIARSRSSSTSLALGPTDLNEREKKILSLRFYAGKTQMEVAGEIGISQAQVSRLEKNALSKIRKNIFPS